MSVALRFCICGWVTDGNDLEEHRASPVHQERLAKARANGIYLSETEPRTDPSEVSLIEEVPDA